MMRSGKFKKQFTMTAATFFLAMLPYIATELHAQSANDSTTVVAAGYSRIYGNVEDAKGAALAESLRFAVQKAASEILFEDQMTGDFETISSILYTNPNQFIQNYRILREFQAGRSYRVLIRATVITDKIKEDLASAGMQTRPDELPSVLFMVAERHLDEINYRYWWQRGSLPVVHRATSPMAAILMEKGFSVIDPGHATGNINTHHQGLLLTATPANYEAAVFGRRMGAQLVVLGTAEVSPGTNRIGDDFRTYIGSVNLRVIDTKTGQQLTTLRREMIAAGNDPERFSINAMADAAYQAGMQLSSRIESLWRQMAAPTGGIMLSLSGPDILSNLEHFRRTIAGFRDISSVRTMRLSPDIATLWVDFKGTPDELVDRLLKQSYGAFGINVTNISDDKLTIQIVRDMTSEILSE